MSYYDHFFSREKEITKIGEKIVAIQNKRILKLIKRYLHNSDCINLLEIGPGRGRFARLALEDERICYTAIEGNLRQADFLRSSGIDVTSGMAPPIVMPDKSKHVVLVSQLLEHMQDNQKAIELAEGIYKVLEHGGLVVIISPDYLASREDFFDGDYTHNYVTTVRRCKQLIEDQGFETVYVNYRCGPFVGNLLTSIISCFIRLLFFPTAIALLRSNRKLEERIYKVKSTFLRSFIVIGEKCEKDVKNHS